MFGLSSKEDPNLRRNRKAQQLRDKEWREHRQEERQNIEPRPVALRQKHSPKVIRFK